jgi:hypothetical protein
MRLPRWKATVVALALAVTPAIAAASPAAAAVPNNYIENQTTIASVAIGVMHDAHYDRLYDTTLAAGKRTNQAPLSWDHSSSVYIGPGWCAQVRRHVHGTSTWVRAERDIGPDELLYVSYDVDYRVAPYRAATSTRCV